MKYLLQLLTFWILCIWLFITIVFFGWYAIFAWGIILFLITKWMARGLE